MIRTRLPLKTSFFLLIATTTLSLTQASNQDHSKKEKHKHHHGTEKHVHGEGTLDIVVGDDWKSAEFEMHLPGMDLFGFERVAKTPQEKTKVDSTLSQLKNELPSSFLFQPALNCQVTIDPASPEIETEGEHLEVHIELKATCDKPLKATNVEFKFSKALQRFNKFEVQVIAPQSQTAKTIKKPGGKIEFK